MKKFAIDLILIYKAVLSPYWPATCRFQPTCSQYALEVLAKERTTKALALIASRLLSCGPWAPLFKTLVAQQYKILKVVGTLFRSKKSSLAEMPSKK